MSWNIAGFFIAAFVVYMLWSIIDYFVSAKGKFWRAVGKQPEKALFFLMMEEGDCFVDPVERPSREFAGPFRVPTSNGVVHKVYIQAKRIEEIQARVMTQLSRPVI